MKNTTNTGGASVSPSNLNHTNYKLKWQIQTTTLLLCAKSWATS